MKLDGMDLRGKIPPRGTLLGRYSTRGERKVYVRWGVKGTHSDGGEELSIFLSRGRTGGEEDEGRLCVPNKLKIDSDRDIRPSSCSLLHFPFNLQ